MGVVYFCGTEWDRFLPVTLFFIVRLFTLILRISLCRCVHRNRGKLQVTKNNFVLTSYDRDCVICNPLLAGKTLYGGWRSKRLGTQLTALNLYDSILDMSHMANLAHLANLVPGSEIMGDIKARDKICRREEEKVQLILCMAYPQNSNDFKLTIETRIYVFWCVVGISS